MISVIAGNKGTGKTKRLLDLTNEAVATESGYIVFIDDDKRYMYDLKHEVRFIDAGEFTAIKKCSWESFFSFISGMLSVNFDITMICVDAFLKLVTGTPVDEMEPLFNALELLSEKHGVKFVISVSADTASLPAFITKYIV